VDEVLTLLPDRLGTLELDIRSGDVHSSTKGVLRGNEIARLYLELSTAAEVWGKELTTDGVQLLAGRNAFDPVQRYLSAVAVPPLPLEQWERLDHYLLGIDDPIARQALPRFLIAAVGRTFEPGCYVRQVPVLIGPQDRGKTALGRILFGDAHWIEGVDCMDKDARMRCHTAWGVELAELDGVTRRRDQEQLKAFLTEAADSFRKPYDRAPERYPRKFVFWGTANRSPLRDSTGSTRFLCIGLPDRMLPLQWAVDNRDALWARAVQQYRAGVQWASTSEEERAATEERNAAYAAEHDPWGELLPDYLETRKMAGRLPVTVSEVLEHLEVDRGHQSPALSRRVREIAELSGWRHARRLWYGKQRQGLWPPD
jgi:predicted P-loop ATPase